MSHSATPKGTWLVDFDRTLFDTSLFVKWMWSSLATEYGVDEEREKTRAKDFYEYSGDWYDYKFFEHIAQIPQLSTVTPEELTTRLRGLIDRPDFMFADARAALSLCDEIITFGNQPYQEFKLGFCPELATVPRMIIQQSKAQYISEQYVAPVVLVDDKHLEDELPEWVFFVLVDRTQEQPFMRHRSNFVSVNSLEELHHL